MQEKTNGRGVSIREDATLCDTRGGGLVISHGQAAIIRKVNDCRVELFTFKAVRLPLILHSNTSSVRLKRLFG